VRGVAGVPGGHVGSAGEWVSVIAKWLILLRLELKTDVKEGGGMVWNRAPSSPHSTLLPHLKQKGPLCLLTLPLVSTALPPIRPKQHPTNMDGCATAFRPLKNEIWRFYPEWPS